MEKKEKQKISDNKEKDEEKPTVARTAVDLQRLKLLKLMKNVDKPITLPERPKVKNTPSVPEFVRNVMGSSAGAGSGEFHVYRHLRRKEYARQKFIQEKGHKELLDIQYHEKLEENKRLAEEATAKRRAKRLKKKQGRKQKKIKTTKEDITIEKDDDEEGNSSEEEKPIEKETKTMEENSPIEKETRTIEEDQPSKKGTNTVQENNSVEEKTGITETNSEENNEKNIPNCPKNVSMNENKTKKSR